VLYDDNTLGCQGYCMYTRALDSRSGEGQLLSAAGNRPLVDPNALHPLWTTNNRFIFRGCNTWSNQPGICGLWVMEGNGGTPRQLTESPDHIPTDVNGNMVVYYYQGDIYRLDVPSGATKQLTFDPANDGLATISPDGNWVAFVSNREGKLAVWYTGVNEGPPKQLFDIRTIEWGELASDAWFEEKLAWGN